VKPLNRSSKRDISDRLEGRAINPKADSKSRSTGKGKENSNEFQLTILFYPKTKGRKTPTVN